MLRLLDMVENVDGDVSRADDAEERAIEEVRHLGKELLCAWGQRTAEEAAAQLARRGGVVHQTKKLHWHSTFGDIEVVEQVYRAARGGGLHRPFVRVAGVACRGYSRPLQRVIADFGADVPFARVSDKLREHYGIRVPTGAAATVTYRHAQALTIGAITPRNTESVTPLTLIAEADGSMIPVVHIAPAGDAGPHDKRKRRVLLWKEARLTLVRRPEAIEPAVAVTLGDASAAGEHLNRLAQASGLHRHTRIHGLGDGAPWIADQIERQFGTQGQYLIDFYHLCDYLAAAAPVCAPANAADWLAVQKIRFKSGQLTEVMADLEQHLEPDATTDSTASPDRPPRPVRDAHRYIANRPNQFNYAAAMAANLPIGSGEVESAHRYVIQKRLKLPGAWWKPDNAQAMLNLRCLRANHRWNDYWSKSAA
jgi:hypothetical protein